MLKTKKIVSFLLFISIGVCAEENLVYVNTSSPYEVKVRKIEKETLEKTIESIKPNQSKWEKFDKLNVSYIVQQETVSILEPDPCYTLPIKIVLKNGKLKSAKYVSSGGNCKAGSSVSSKIIKSEGFYITPKQLFQRLEQANELLKCYQLEASSSCITTALSVSYNDKYGFPVKMNDSGYLVMDYTWSLNVTELEVSE